MSGQHTSAAGPPLGARPPGGERRAAPIGGDHTSAAGPPQGARPPRGEWRAAPIGGDHTSAADPDEPLARHTLAWPTSAAQRALAAQLTDDVARAALDTWFDHGFPFVVRRTEADALLDDDIGVGLPLPTAQGRSRLALRIARADVARSARPLALDRVAAALPPAWRSALKTLDCDARALGVRLRVFGSAAWQAITGLAYLRDGSDLDLLLHPADAAELDATLALYERWPHVERIRLDGEVVFPGGDAVAWREWASAPAGARLLAKHLAGAHLVSRDDLLARLAPACVAG